MSEKVRMVMEIDEYGEKRPVKLEVTSKHVVRTCKTLRWESRTAISVIHNLKLDKSWFAADTVTASTKKGEIKWKVKKSKALIEAIQDAQS